MNFPWRFTVLTIAFMLVIVPINSYTSTERVVMDDELFGSYYDENTGTIHVTGTGNTLYSIVNAIDDTDVIMYDQLNSTTYCYADITIEGFLDIENETLLFAHEKTLRVSTGVLNITGSKLAGIEEEKHWWEMDNRYVILNEIDGTTSITDSMINGIGWDGRTTGKRGVEIYGGNFELINSTFSDGLNGLIFHDAGDVTSSMINNITVKGMSDRGIVLSGTPTKVHVTNSSFYGNRGYDIHVGNRGNITLINCTYQNWEIINNGIFRIGYIHDFYFYDENGHIAQESIEIKCNDTGRTWNYHTDINGELESIALIWKVINSTSAVERNYQVSWLDKTTYFSPSNHNHISINMSMSDRLYVTDVTVFPLSYVPVNNDWEPHNITLTATVHNHIGTLYNENISFFFRDIPIASFEIEVPDDSFTVVNYTWIPDLDGYGKIRAEIDFAPSMSDDNLKAWSNVFFAGYYNKTIQEYHDHLELMVSMAEIAAANEDGDDHYTIYKNWLPDILSEVGLGYMGAHHITGNSSYLLKGEKQLDYVLSLRDGFGLFNRSTVNEVRGLYTDTYHEWSTHQNVRAALAMQQAYLYTGNESYREFYDRVIDFILNQVALVNITYHNGVNYTVPWESTIPNGMDRGEQGTSKDFPFLFVNGYIQLGRVLVQAYFDEGLNSTYYRDDRILTHMYTSISYVLNDQIYTGESEGTWPYFSYFDEPNPWRRRSMKYAALTAMELGNINSYLNWQNITSAIEIYSDYIEDHLTIRTAIDTNNGGSGVLETYSFVRSLYNTTGNNVSKIDAFAFSNVFMNQDGMMKWFNADTDSMEADPERIGFIYLHYGPLRTYLWDVYHQSRMDHSIEIELKEGWNFISVPIVPDKSGLIEILEDPDNGIIANCEKVIFYDRAEGRWRSYVPGRAAHYNYLTSWDHTHGIWVYMNTPDNLTVTGRRPYRTWIRLEPGWNMVGYPSEKSGSVGIPEEVSIVGYFDPYETYYVAYDHDPDNFIFQPGEGYLLFSDASEPIYWIVDF